MTIFYMPLSPLSISISHPLGQEYEMERSWKTQKTRILYGTRVCMKNIKLPDEPRLALAAQRKKAQSKSAQCKTGWLRDVN